MSKLSLGERLLLLGQIHILKALSGKGEMSPDDIDRAWTIVADGRSTFYDEIFGSLSEQESDGTVENQVAEILNMYRALAKAGITKSDGTYATFQGFDGNYESAHHSAAIFWIKTMDRFGEQGDAELNSHHPTIDAYNAMLDAWGRVGRSYELTRPQALEIVAAGDAH